MKNSCDLNHTKLLALLETWKRSMMFLYDLEEIAGIAGYPKANCGAHCVMQSDAGELAENDFVLQKLHSVYRSALRSAEMQAIVGWRLHP